MVVPSDQGTPSPPHQLVTGSNLNPAGRPLQATSSGGRKNYNLSTTSKHQGQTPIGRVYSSGCKETTVGKGGKTIRDEGGTP